MLKAEHQTPIAESLAQYIQGRFTSLKNQLPAGSGIILLHNHNIEKLQVVVHSSPSVPVNTTVVLPLDESFMVPRVFAAQGATTLMVPDALQPEEARFFRQFNIRSLLVAPLTINGKPVGMVMVGRANLEAEYSPFEIAALEKLARTLGDGLARQKNDYERDRDRFLLLNELMANPTLVLDDQLAIFQANAAAVQLFGIDKQRLRGMSLASLIAGDAHRLQQLHDIEEGGAAFFETMVQRPDGPVFYVDVNASLITLNGVSMIKVFLRDITQRKTAEEDVLRLNKHVTHILESTNDAYIAFDDVWNVTYCNTRAATLFQVQRDDVTGRPLKEILPEVSRAFQHRFQHSLNNELVLAFESFYPPSERWIEIQTFPHADGLSVFFRDITERRRTDNLLRERELHLRTLLNNMLDGVMTIDSHGAIQSFNSAAEQITGYLANEVVGHDVRDIAFDIKQGEHDTGLWDFLGGDKNATAGRRFEVEITHRDGRRFPAELSIGEMEFGNDWSYIISLRDISEKKAAEQELVAHRHHLEDLVRDRTRDLMIARDQADQASRTKTVFLANMSHELRTPLTAIIGYSELLEENPQVQASEIVLGDIKNIDVSARHLLSLINNILDLSKIEAGKQEMHLEPFRVEALLEEVTATMMPLMSKNGNEFTVSCDAQLGSMTADSMWVRQSLLNLLGNAAKFTQQGNIHLHASLQQNIGGEQVHFMVTDTGIGMTSQQQSRLFQAFQQGDPEINARYGGTGLGLAISQRLCRTMGGDILVESEAGKGSTFTICLPLDVKDAGVKAAEDSSSVA